MENPVQIPLWPDGLVNELRLRDHPAQDALDITLLERSKVDVEDIAARLALYKAYGDHR